MSEWYTCPECKAWRENFCACGNPSCPESVSGPVKPWAVYSRIVLNTSDVFGTWERVHESLDKDEADRVKAREENLHPSRWFIVGVNVGPRLHPLSVKSLEKV